LPSGIERKVGFVGEGKGEEGKNRFATRNSSERGDGGLPGPK